MRTLSTFILGVLLVAGFQGCTAPRTAAAKGEASLATEIKGHWIGTYYQDNIRSAYPMQLTADPKLDGFSVTLDWPTLRGSQTVGVGKDEDGHLTWTENELVRGGQIALGGVYRAAFLDNDTLVGRYANSAGGSGFFTLSRDGSGVALASAR